MADVVLYYVSVSSSVKIKKDQQNLEWLLEKKGIPYKKVDVATNIAEREKMRQASGVKTVPQLFVNGKYIGNYDDVQDLEEQDKLEKILDA